MFQHFMLFSIFAVIKSTTYFKNSEEAIAIGLTTAFFQNSMQTEITPIVLRSETTRKKVLLWLQF